MKRLVVLLLGCATAFSAGTAQAQPSSNSPHSVVRFRISYGLNFFGDIDVDLFDADKPVTVSNFLSYAQSDRYRSTLLHRCVPGVLLHGGEWTIASPASALPFQSVSRIPVDASITNEFRVGSVRSNLFGTLAMWKPPGGTNSAASQWFFNLGDNSHGAGSTNLDTANGGFTVFGQVTAGTNLLEYFNSLSENQGLLNMTNANYQGFCSPVQLLPDNVAAYPFDALPVAFTNFFSCPFYPDLFTVQILLLSGPDTTPPRITITAPRADGVVTNEDVVVTGSATDNTAVGSVRIYWGSHTPILATLSSNVWTATLTNVPPGTNTILVEATDSAGLRAQAARSFFRSVRAPLQLQVLGNGTVTGATNQQQLELARGYTLLARAAPGNLFAGWDGDFLQANPKLIFLMDSNTSVRAVFGTNLFPVVKGTYQGLFFDPLSVEPQSSGFVTLSVGNLGAYSAKLLMHGRSYRVSGTFHVDGKATNFVTRPGTNALLIRLALDLTGGTDQLTGVVTNNQLMHVDASRSWSAGLQADRTLFNSKTNPAPLAGRYTLAIPSDPSSVAGPGGDSVGTVLVSSRGSVASNVRFTDGTRASQSTSLSKNGEWPLYLSPTRDQAVIISWVTFDTHRPDTDLEGLLNWFRLSRPQAKYYPAGFTNEVTAVGSRYVRSLAPSRVLSFTNGVVAFAGADLGSNFTNQVLLDANSRVANQSTNRLSLSIARSDGLFSGAVSPPGSRRLLSFRGAVLQKRNLGVGFFLGTNVSGQVTMEAEP